MAPAASAPSRIDSQRSTLMQHGAPIPQAPTPKKVEEPPTPKKKVDPFKEEYKSFVLTPQGSIIRTISGPDFKPETDPEWEARKAARKAKGSSSYDSAPASPAGSISDVVVDDSW